MWAVAFAAAACSRAPKETPPAWSPVLVVEHGPAAAPPKDDTLPAGALLLLNAMSEAERQELARAFGDLADDIAVKKNPLVEELDESYDAASALGRELARVAPRLAAARALAAGAWSSQDGDLTVRAAATCPSGATCLPALRAITKSAPPPPRDEARARFFAWPIADAVVLHASAAEEDALRAAALEKESRIALVLRASDLHAVRPSPGLLAIAKNAAKVLRVAPDTLPHKDLFQRLADAAAPRDPAPWLHPPDDAIVVVPRAFALSTLDAFEAEIHARAPGAAWLARPIR